MSAVLVALALAGAAATSPSTVAVTARGETTPVGSAAQDAADDPAIWRNRRAPAASLIVATDKKAGLYVYGLDGGVRDFHPAGRLNNVDLIDLGGREGVIVVASDRNDEANAHLLIYRLDTRAAKLRRLGRVPAGSGEAYGVCLARLQGKLNAFSVLKDGQVVHLLISVSADTASAETARIFKLSTQTEGCVVDVRTATLYVGEEDRGVWAFDARASAALEGRLVAPVDNAHLHADVEGLALAPKGRRGGWLIASSQGDNAYALYALPSLEPVGRFRVSKGAFGATEETDGIAFAAGRFDVRFPQGLFVAQDGVNAPEAQNFKLVSWRDVLTELRRRAPNRSARPAR